MYKQYSQLGDLTQNDTPITEIKSLENREEIIKNNPMVCIDVFAHWCQPCRNIKSYYRDLQNHYRNIKFAEENSELELSENIKALPTFLLYRRGVLINTVQGADKKKLTEALESMILDSTTKPAVHSKSIRNTRK